MHLFHPHLYATCILAAAALPGTLYAQAPALAGQWQFQTATGTTTTNGVEVDLIDTGILDITEEQAGWRATIAWLDERGQLTPSRTVKGTPGPAGTIFRHGGKRVSTGRNGQDISTEVTIRWTLQAKGDLLSGERLVETDENEPKPVSGTRLKERYVPPALPAAPPVASGAARGPSTPAERARVVQMAQEAQRDPLAVQQRDGAWLGAWIEAIPDFTLPASALESWLSIASQAAIREATVFQYLASAMAFQIEHPGQAGQQSASDLAGMQGVLRAYETLLRQDKLHRSAKLDAALAARRQDRLPAFLATLSGRDAGIEASIGAAPSPSGDATARRIVALGTSEPRAMDWLDILSNRFGGRMAGSDAYTHAAQWARMQLQQWGVQAELEEAGQMPVGFNRGPWSGKMLAPREQPLRLATPAYTAGTRGVQQGLAIVGPATLEEALERAAQFKGKWVLTGGENSGGGRDGKTVHQPRAITRVLMQAGALGTIQSGEEPLYAASAAPSSWAALPTLPDIKLAAPQYADIRQRVARGEAVTLEFDIRNWFYPGPVAYHNVVARIPGTEKPEEIVLIGAHLDSYDGGTGAADNGGGVATMLEAMRLLAKSDARPRRTIMLAAFGAEEIGRKGSFAFAERHAGKLHNIVMMLNRDGRPGAIDGIAIPSAWQPVFGRVEQALQDIHPVFGFATTINDVPRDASKAMSARAGSDDAVFSLHGVPTPKFTVLGDFDYARVHHTVLDTYDSVQPFSSAQQYSAIAIALSAYEVANAPEELSRKGYYRAAKAAQ
ncbi:M20/M25/M40 family metallo-hydrolase [Janthinobacterium lividum]|uniref:Carboxypeptidase Q n=1 Tax=Janthinobacterium lividum TaxID=29581 RepID=A0ABU0XMU9_9BURK|nr:M20/M25/M40 family metallo-hydrolase [Janthinobacterium lividum]MDQ4624839.1 M20/M25/M40 family metallo-hydrolase [Janthinobacterium lividum]MDQ4673558.1 M20/M25/M40 family metallo-hydrolase [Janthinobacterium lividum]MDQ4684288.1 M20/M25/M40 family metallo-hydrolase [Janthinobacterium lividum]